MGQKTRTPAGRSSLTWLWCLTLAAVLVMGAISLVRPMTTYKLLALDAGGFTIGWIGALYSLLPLFCIFYLGGRAQRAPSLKPLLIGGSVTVAAGSALLAVSGNIPMVALGTVVVGMGQLIFAIAGQATIARFAANNQLDLAFGWFTAGFSTGQMLGPIAGGVMLGEATTGAAGHADIDVTLWVGAAAAGAVLIILLAAGRIFRAPVPVAKEETTKEPESKPRLLQILKVPKMPSYILASVALLAMVDMLMTFLPLLGEAAGVSPFWIGIFLAVRAGASILSRLVMPLMRRIASRHLLVQLALWVSGLSLALLPVVIHHIPLAIALMIFSGFFLGIGQPLTMSQVTQAVPADWRSPALAVRLMGNRVGQVAIPLAAGALAGLWGPAAPIWLACSLLLGSGAQQLVPQGKPRGKPPD